LKSLSERSPIVANWDKTKLCFLRNDRKLCSLLIPTTMSNYIELPKSYDEYNASLPSKLRKLLKRCSKKLDKLDNAKFVLREDQRSTQENMNHFIEAEHSGWKKENGSSIKSHPKHSAALLMAAEDLKKRDWLEWNYIEAENNTIAAHYSIRINCTVYVLKIGYVDEYKSYSPGSLLFNKMIENSYQQGDVEEINTLGDYPWQYQWQVKSRQLYDCLLLPRIPVVCCSIKLFFFLMRKKQTCCRKK